MFETSFCHEQNEFPPLAANTEDYRAQALTSTVLHAHLSDLPALNARRPPPPSSGEVGRAGLCGRLRSARGRNSLVIAAEGGNSSFSSLPREVAICYQASRQCSQRGPIRGFEPRTSFGTKNVTKKNLFQTVPPSMFDCLCTYKALGACYSDLESDSELGMCISDLVWGGTIT